MTSRAEVFDAINSERAYQRSRAIQSGKPDEAPHSIEEFALYMEDYLREAITQLARTWTPTGQVPAALDTIRKVTALGVACMEQHGAPRREGF